MSGQSNILLSYGEAAASNGLLTGLVSYWKLDETSGTTAYDAHGTNDGTITGATVNATGKISTAYSFDGAGDYVNLGNIATPSAYSVAVWFNCSNVSDYRTLICKRNLSGNGNTDNWGLRLIAATGYLQSTIFYADGLSYNEYTYATNLADGNWHHVVQTFDGNIHKLYVDGSLVYTSSPLGGTTKTSSTLVYIGRTAHSSVFQYWHGKIDEIGLWGVILTAGQVAALASVLPYSSFTS